MSDTEIEYIKKCITEDGYYININVRDLHNCKRNLFSPTNKYAIENINKYIKDNNIKCELLSNESEYTSSYTKLNWVCANENCDNIFKRTWGSVKKGAHYCDDCSRKNNDNARIKGIDTDELLKLCNENNCTLIENQNLQKLKQKDKIKFKCNIHCNEIQEKTLHDFKTKKIKCKFCSIENRSENKRVPEEELKRRVLEKGLIYNGVEYQNGNDNGRSKILFTCPDHYDVGIQKSSYSTFKKSIYNCKYCALEKTNSKLYFKVIEYIKELGYNVNVEQNCSLKLYNEETNRPLPYDIEVIELKLIIEVNGEQHYRKTSPLIKMVAKSKNISIDDAFNKRKKYDEIKKIYAIENGYYFLEIPYTLEKNDEYKKIIDNKINDILQKSSETAGCI